MELNILLWSTFFYFLSFCYTLFALRKGNFHAGRFHFLCILLGFFTQSWLLTLRGASEHACPIRTLFELLIFVSWSIGLFYLLIGSAYRISLMGVFTAPLILGLQCGALFFSRTTASPLLVPPRPWVEAHASLSLLSFGAFGLAAVAGIMFLVQERQLKSQHPSALFHYLPPISLLTEVTVRLLWAGFLLLTISFAAGLIAGVSIAGVKLWSSFFLWGFYLLVLVLRGHLLVTPHRFALFSVAIFLLALILLPGIHYFSAHLGLVFFILARS